MMLNNLNKNNMAGSRKQLDYNYRLKMRLEEEIDELEKTVQGLQSIRKNKYDYKKEILNITEELKNNTLKEVRGYRLPDVMWVRTKKAFKGIHEAYRHIRNINNEHNKV